MYSEKIKKVPQRLYKIAQNLEDSVRLVSSPITNPKRAHAQCIDIYSKIASLSRELNIRIGIFFEKPSGNKIELINSLVLQLTLRLIQLESVQNIVNLQSIAFILKDRLSKIDDHNQLYTIDENYSETYGCLSGFGFIYEELRPVLTYIDETLKPILLLEQKGSTIEHETFNAQYLSKTLIRIQSPERMNVDTPPESQSVKDWYRGDCFYLNGLSFERYKKGLPPNKETIELFCRSRGLSPKQTNFLLYQAHQSSITGLLTYASDFLMSDYHTTGQPFCFVNPIITINATAGSAVTITTALTVKSEDRSGKIIKLASLSLEYKTAPESMWTERQIRDFSYYFPTGEVTVQYSFNPDSLRDFSDEVINYFRKKIQVGRFSYVLIQEVMEESSLPKRGNPTSCMQEDRV